MISRKTGRNMGEYVVEPKVTLVSWMCNTEKAIHALTQNMFGNMITDLSEISDEEAQGTMQELTKTSLGGPLEAGEFIFQVEMVPRSFTHQMVRTRIGASYSQESLRFAVKNEGQFNFAVGPSIVNEEQLEEYFKAMEDSQLHYDRLIELGVAPEDARGVLPINIATCIGVKYNLNTLINVAKVRLCIQSQKHWVSVVNQMKKEIAEKVSPQLASFLKPFCQHTGRCGYKSVYDRKCPIQDTLEK